MKTKKSALGRGLSAILESPETDITSKDISGNYVVGAIANLALEKIEANPFQPRNEFEQEALRELADSIREQGVIQPVTVRKLGYDKYQLISGERRYKAARIAGLKEVPCYIRVANDQQMLELALIENIHRKDLNSIEIAISYNRLLEECDLTQEKLSKRIGKDRTTIANYIRLLKLPAQVQVAIRKELITNGHARALISIPDSDLQLRLLDQIIKQDLSVREVENLVRRLSDTGEKPVSKPSPPLAAEDKAARKSLEDHLHTRVEIRKNTKGQGSIVIKFKSEDEFERIINILGKE